ncbi:MAG: DUF1697 domain-containing protein [Steroidobacteraceae bacterium]|jgi:uncharacterized protein (DUF1697 family)
MGRYVALLRAVNVGGTGTLPMSALKSICRDAGFKGIETYIASGNVVFDSQDGAAQVRSTLMSGLRAYSGKSIGVFVRTAAEMRAVLAGNPFARAPPGYTYAFFLADKPPGDAIAACSGRLDEQIRLGRREIYVYYPSGMGKSRLRIPAARRGTARNINTIAKLAAMSSSKPREELRSSR